MPILGRLNLYGWSSWQRIFRCKKKGLCSVRSTHQQLFQGTNNGIDVNINKNNVSRNFLHSSRSCQKYFPHPDPVEAEKLLEYFPDPVRLVEELLQPLISLSPSSKPSLTFKPYRKATKWKAILSFTDPLPFTVIGCADCYNKAKTNVYLQACQMFWYLGLINKFKSDIVPAEETIKNLLSKLSKDDFSIFKRFQISFDQLNMNNQRKWRSTLEIFWPNHIAVSAICDTPSGAEYKCYLLTIIKLKWAGFLNFYNDDLRPYSWIKLPVVLDRDSFDYHIYFDASKTGFGAYFFSPNGSDVNWFHEHWPDCLEKEILENNRRDSTFMEMYAMVSALYTWKHKFCNQSVLFYSDNLSLIHLINDGLCLLRKPSHYQKLFKIIKGVCHTYQISLGAKHIHREKNAAADCLARSEVEKFRQIMPNARERSKKTKKLLFWLPLK